MKKVGDMTECCLAGRNLCLDNGGDTERKQLSPGGEEGSIPKPLFTLLNFRPFWESKGQKACLSTL